MLFRTLRPLLAADWVSFSTISPWLIDVLG